MYQFLRNCAGPVFQFLKESVFPFLRNLASDPVLIQFLKNYVSGPTFQFGFYIFSHTQKLLLTNAFIKTSGFLFLLNVLCLVIRDFVFRYFNRKYKWIEREKHLLEGLLKDIESDSYREIIERKKVHEYFDPDQIHGEASVRVLNGWQDCWKTKAGEVRDEADRCLHEMKAWTSSNIYRLECLLSATFHLAPLLHLALRIYKLNQFLGKNEVDVDIGTSKKKIGASGICRSLEQSRSRVVTLQTSKGEEIEYQYAYNWSYIHAGTLIPDLLVPSVENQVTGNADLIQSLMMHVKLLNAYVGELWELKEVETHMEERWLTEAIKTHTASKQLIIDITAKRKNTKEISSWLLKLGNCWARRKEEEDIMRVVTEIYDLLLSKERYGFRFKLDWPKSTHQSPQNPFSCQQKTDDVELLSSVNQIHKWLDQLQGTNNNEAVVSQVSSMRKELEQMHKLFKERMATEDYASGLRNGCLKQLKETADEAQNLSHCHLQRIMEVVNLLQRCLRVYTIEARVKPHMSVVGLEEDVHNLVLRLTTGGGRMTRIISIVGMHGIGKTTLARKLYAHNTIENHFPVRRWVSNSRGDISRYDLEFSEEHRQLIIFDQVSSNEIMQAIRVAASQMVTNGSKIVLITDHPTIASNADDDKSPHQLRLRTRKESWEIFTQIVDYCPPHLEALAKKVVERTGGLPVAIKHLGYRMSLGRKMTSERLARELEYTIQGQNKQRWLDCLSVNQEKMQPHQILSKCISYFQHFAGHIELPARRIIASWVALGFVQQGEEAHDKLTEMIGGNLIQVVQRKANGEVKTCCMPPCLLEHLMEDKGESKGTRSDARTASSTTKGLGGKLAIHIDDQGVSFHHIQEINITSQDVMIDESFQEPILIFDTGEGNKLREEGELLRRGIAAGFFRQLQVLDLERVFRPHLPTVIGELKLLAYLGLRWTYIATIPSSIGNLVNLLTLDLKHTHVRSLPSSIWKLKKLRHLYLSQICGIEFMPLPTAISLRFLQTLSGVYVNKRNHVKDRLDKLTSLQKLALAFQLQPTEQKVLEKWISKLTNLRSLKLQSVNDDGERQSLSMSEAFFNLKELHSLYLFGKIEVISRLPENLTHLTLEASNLKRDPMSELEKLPKLKSLFLNSGSYAGKQMVCSSNCFPLLFVFKLWNLDALEKLVVEKGAMKNLGEMEIKSCNNLVVTGLEELKLLQKHTVH